MRLNSKFFKVKNGGIKMNNNNQGQNPQVQNTPDPISTLDLDYRNVMAGIENIKADIKKFEDELRKKVPELNKLKNAENNAESSWISENDEQEKEKKESAYNAAKKKREDFEKEVNELRGKIDNYKKDLQANKSKIDSYIDQLMQDPTVAPLLQEKIEKEFNNRKRSANVRDMRRKLSAAKDKQSDIEAYKNNIDRIAEALEDEQDGDDIKVAIEEVLKLKIELKTLEKTIKTKPAADPDRKNAITRKNAIENTELPDAMNKLNGLTEKRGWKFEIDELNYMANEEVFNIKRNQLKPNFKKKYTKYLNECSAKTTKEIKKLEKQYAPYEADAKKVSGYAPQAPQTQQGQQTPPTQQALQTQPQKGFWGRAWDKFKTWFNGGNSQAATSTGQTQQAPQTTQTQPAPQTIDPQRKAFLEKLQIFNGAVDNKIDRFIETEQQRIEQQQSANQQTQSGNPPTQPSGR